MKINGRFEYTPIGQYLHYSDGLNGGIHRLTARLYRQKGSWWLEYEDGHHEDTRHQANGPNAYHKRTMVKIIHGEPH